ncbi:MAG: AMP-binding protein [Bacteroidales bacterium]|nr:AMP-binding protein [Bacteroidales bacterium]MDZ4203208.1 AMP-binding protein [Bacteroidales bacterium]
MSNLENVKNVAAMYQASARKYGELPAFATKLSPTKWKAITYGELYETGLNLATGLIDLGVKAKEHIAILSDNRVEWIIADYGVQLCGAADVPRGSDITDSEITYILDHADVRVVFVENTEMLARLQVHLPVLKKITAVILMIESSASHKGVLTLQEVIENGKKSRENGSKKAEERIAAIEEDSLFTLIYTAGTTGVPKGVMLTHKNMISQVEQVPIQVYTNDRVLSILPVWHIFERVFEMMAINVGCCTYYSNRRTIAEDLKQVQPSFLGSAPRLWENLYQKIKENVRKAHPIRRMLFSAAYFCSHVFQDSVAFFYFRKPDLRGRNLFTSLLLAVYNAIRWVLILVPYGILNAGVMERIRLSVGGSFKGSVSGGGALPLHIDQFFNYIGIPVLEGYGMTETSPILAVRSYERLVIGTVGPVFPGTEIKILDINSGEILYPNPSKPHNGRGLKGVIHARGPQVMKGYYKEEEKTREVLQDGFMNTGDIGMITFNNCLKLFGRTKDTIVLFGGENVEPIAIEAKLLESAFIDQCMVVGQDEKSLGALIVPSLNELQRSGISVQTLEEAANNEKVKKLIAAEIKREISKDQRFKSYEKVRDFILLPKALEVGDELTGKLSLKRYIITEKYKKNITEMNRRAK